MVGRAQSSTKKARKKREDVEWWMARVVRKYCVQQTWELGCGERRAGARAICTQVKEEYNQKFKKKIKNQTLQPLHNTMLAQYRSRASKSKSAESRGWLLVEEVEVVLKYLLECACRGFPLDHQRLKEVVDAICCARLEDAFPKGGVGKKWTQRFLERYSSRLKTHRPREREDKRGQAVNPVTNKLWFELLGATLRGEKDFEFYLPLVEETDGNGPEDSDSDSDIEDTDGDEGETTSAGAAGPSPEDDEEMPGLAGNSDDEEDEEDGDEEMPRDDAQPERSGSSTPAPPTPILPENIYGADESGFMATGSTAKHVIGPSKQNTQHKRTDGDRENITVVNCIDAIGGTNVPVVIFKGWVQEDPLECSYVRTKSVSRGD
uniref:HTH CENPB-type domain-containing protein n=1 Tax=Mycena chlorophos TaxID=658473 RepID=A0ABQ0LUG1_MYCCL|nr:predicted protein [Mycena chlorophos]